MAEVEGLPSDRASLEEKGERFWIFVEDWSNSYSALAAKDLIDGDAAGFGLTDAGRPIAETYHRERPDHYWYYYQRFYPAALASRAHSQLCQRVFGQDLCQEGQMDMPALSDLLERLDLKEGNRVLDLGCGAGVISEYISDVTGSKVTGIDYAASAVAAATGRTRDKRARLQFIKGDLNSLQLEPESYDAAILIDSIYWAADMTDTVTSIIEALVPNGRIAIVIAQTLEDEETDESLDAANTQIAKALQRVEIDYVVIDQTAEFREFWPRMKKTVVDLRPDFEAEGNSFIADALEQEADEEYLPAISDGAIRRYLYLGRK